MDRTGSAAPGRVGKSPNKPGKPLSFLSLCLVTLLGCAESLDSTVLVFRRVAVIDGTGRPPAFEQTVVVSGSRITAVGPSRTITIPLAAHVVEGGGLDFVKAYSTLRPDVFHAIADEANTVGIAVAGHVPIAMSPVEAAEAGMTSQEHLNEILESCSSQADGLRRIAWQDWTAEQDAMTVESFDATRCAEIVAGLARTRTAHVPTLCHRSTLRLGADWASVLEDPRLQQVPQPWRDQWLQYGRRMEQELRASGMGPVNVTRFERALWLTAELHRSGIPIMTGTDLGNPFVFPGSSVHDELKLMVEAGLSPMDALRAGTSVPASFAGAADSLGTVEVGKLADLVLLHGNPLEDIENSRKIAGVVLNGRYFDSAQLTELTRP